MPWNHLLSNIVGVDVEPAALLLALPALVVPEHEGPLLVGLLDGVEELGRVQRLDVVEEQGVEVAGRRVAGDLGRLG